MTEGTETICVQGARVHNLKNIDVEIPRDSLTVITGLSGSGKSSLAFDTLFAVMNICVNLLMQKFLNIVFVTFWLCVVVIRRNFQNLLLWH